MSTESGRKNTSVTKQVIEHTHNFSFFQAVRLLERASVFANNSNQNQTRNELKIANNPVAQFTPPGTEVLRFFCYPSLKFPTSEVSSVSVKKTRTGHEQWQMPVNIIGLGGAMGVLPYHYTEIILQRLKMKDESMMHFFDLFNHRTISLFYQAATKYFLPIEYERKQLHCAVSQSKDTATHALLSLIGFGSKHLTHRLYNTDESLINYSGLLSKQIRTSMGLQLILQQHFNIPVKIQEFVGQWQELIDDIRTRLPSRRNSKGQNAQLGRSVMLGHKGWFSQGKIRIVLGPLNKKQLHTFAPGTKALKSLNELVKIYVGMEIDYDFIIRIKRIDLPGRTRLDCTDPPIMGWSTWLSNNLISTSECNDTLDIVVSNNRLK